MTTFSCALDPSAQPAGGIVCTSSANVIEEKVCRKRTRKYDIWLYANYECEFNNQLRRKRDKGHPLVDQGKFSAQHWREQRWKGSWCGTSFVHQGSGLDQRPPLKPTSCQFGHRSEDINWPSGPHRSFRRCMRNTEYGALNCCISDLCKASCGTYLPSIGWNVDGRTAVHPRPYCGLHARPVVCKFVRWSTAT